MRAGRQDPATIHIVSNPTHSSIDKLLLSSTSVALQAGLLEAIEFVQEIGIDRIEERNLDLAGLMKEALAETPECA